MKLTQIGIHVKMSENFSLRQTGGAMSVVEVMYRYYLVNYQTDGVKRVSISLTLNPAKQNEMMQLESVLVLTRLFDPEQYNSSDEFTRKKITLDLIHDAMYFLATKRGWDTKALIDAYNICIDKNIDFKATYKNKYYQSSDRKYFASLYYHWGAEKYRAYAVFYDRKKIEIQRKLILECDSSFVDNFSFVGWDRQVPNEFIILQERPNRRYAAALELQIA